EADPHIRHALDGLFEFAQQLEPGSALHVRLLAAVVHSPDALREPAGRDLRCAREQFRSLRVSALSGHHRPRAPLTLRAPIIRLSTTFIGELSHWRPASATQPAARAANAASSATGTKKPSIMLRMVRHSAAGSLAMFVLPFR